MAAILTSPSASATSQSEIFTSSGTWTRPDSVTSVLVTMIGAGGLGGSGDSFAGGSGAGSSSLLRCRVPVSAATSAVTCGATGDSSFVYAGGTITVTAGGNGLDGGSAGGALGGFALAGHDIEIIDLILGTYGGTGSPGYGAGGQGGSITYAGVTLGPYTLGERGPSSGAGPYGGGGSGSPRPFILGVDGLTAVDIAGGQGNTSAGVSAASYAGCGGAGGGGAQNGGTGGPGFVALYWTA